MKYDYDKYKDNRFQYDPKSGYVRSSGKECSVKRGKRFSFATVALIIAAITVSVTIMYLVTRTTSVTNAFTVGQASINVIEPGVDSGNVSWGSTTKPVKLENPQADGSVPGVVRAIVVPKLADRDTGDGTGGSLGTLGQPSGNTLVLGDITLHFADNWSSNWFYKDGYFYYNKVLNPGEQTSNLLAGVTLTDSSKASEYAEKVFKLDVLADILQIDGTAPEDEWGVAVDNLGNVSPL